MPAGWRIVVDQLTDPQVHGLVALHLRAASENSPPGSVFALDLSRLRDPALTLWTAWEGDTLLGMAALRAIDGETGEIKSMRTAPAQQRRGVARVMLDHVMAAARAQGFATLKLETGTNEAFAPARALYESAGFRPCATFGGYALTDFNRCYALAL